MKFKDLSRIRKAIIDKNDDEVIKLLQMYIDKIPKPAFPIKCFPSDRVDTFSTALIPDDIPIPNHEIVAIKTLGNGNCLYNSVSYLLCRNYSLSSALHLLTAAEL